MGALGGVAVALLVVALVLMVMALVALVPAVVSLRERREVLNAMTKAQRRRLATVVRRGGPLSRDEVSGARAVAAIAAGQWHSVLGSAAGVGLAAGIVVYPWPSGVMAVWVRAFFTVGLVLQLVAGVFAWRSVRRARRFLAANPDPDSVSVGVAG